MQIVYWKRKKKRYNRNRQKSFIYTYIGILYIYKLSTWKVVQFLAIKRFY